MPLLWLVINCCMYFVWYHPGIYPVQYVSTVWNRNGAVPYGTVPVPYYAVPYDTGQL
jgi:hypothetical protein